MEIVLILMSVSALFVTWGVIEVAVKVQERSNPLPRDIPSSTDVFADDVSDLFDVMAEIQGIVEDEMRYERMLAGEQTKADIATERLAQQEASNAERRAERLERKHAYRTNPAQPGAADSESFWNRRNAELYPPKHRTDTLFCDCSCQDATASLGG